MSDKEWEKFFELMAKVVNLPGLSAGEKAVLVKEKAAEFGSETDLGEFAGYAADDE